MTDQLDAFAAYGAQYAKPARPKRVDGVRVLTSEKQAPMKPTAQEQAQRDKSAQLARYKRAKKEEHQALLDDPNIGPYYGRLVGLCRKLPETPPGEIVRHVSGAWTKQLSQPQRISVLGVIDSFIIKAREMDGRPPMDDPLPGSPDNLFILCRKAILGA